MLKNQILMAIRTLRRQKAYSFISIAGLTIGIASCILILLFVTSELSYDRYHEKSDRTYRIGIESAHGGSHFFSAYTSGAMKEALDREFAEIEESCRIFPVSRAIIKAGDRNFIEENFFYADPNFYNVFSVPLIEGDPATALSRPNTIVISEETALRLFGPENPVGKTILMNERDLFEVTGVSENMPHNSHFRYNYLASIETVMPEHEVYFQRWLYNYIYNYIVLAKGTGIEEFNEKLQDLVYRYVSPESELSVGRGIEAFEKEGGFYRFRTENIESIHLHSDADHQVNEGGSMTAVYFFSIIAAFILIIACINFMNLATARFSGRAKEIGVRKTLGGSRGTLVRQFLVESVIVSIISMVMAITLLELSLPFFNNITYKSFELNYFADWYIIPGLVVFSLLTGILAGSYPAFFLSSFKPVKVLKGDTGTGNRSSSLRKILVVAQFAITIALFIATFIVSGQLRFIHSTDKGYEKEGLLILERTQILGDQQEAFRDELLKHEGIINVSYCNTLPGYPAGGTAIYRHGKPLEELTQVMVVTADEHYLETMGMRMAEGRFFSAGYGSDRDAVIINKPLATILGFDGSPDGKIVFPHDDLISPVIGILDDVNFESLHRNIRPMVVRLPGRPAWLTAIRVDLNNTPSAIRHIEQHWTGFAGDAPFIYSFLEDDLMQLYTQEIRARKIFKIFALLAVLIAALGLLGMASFNTEKRTKEIGVRKAMGASPSSIMLLLSREINILVLTAAIISWPAAWLLMDRWLENFAYRIEPGIPAFLSATAITYIIALLTVGIQSWRAANLNPVDVLRNE
ncbi:MAG: ABC transporter permease [Marinilabiliales bacterium]|nr:MAG: ABC transporter permease [Marinilabiliales bacterium]